MIVENVLIKIEFMINQIIVNILNVIILITPRYIYFSIAPSSKSSMEAIGHRPPFGHD